MGYFSKQSMLLLLVLLLSGLFDSSLYPALIKLPAAEAQSIHRLEQKKQTNQQELKRIKQLKKQLLVKEKHVTSNIIQNQKLLDSSRSSMEAQEALLERTKNQLTLLETTLDIVLAEQQELSKQVGERLRSLYIGERLSFLQMILDSHNLSSLLDKIYYRQKIVAQDKKLYETYIVKTQLLGEKRDELVEEKNRLASTLQRIQAYRNQLQEAVILDKLLVSKLKTSREAYEMAENQLQRESYNIERQIVALTRKGGVILGSTGRFMMPVIASITSGFGNRFHPIFRTTRFHAGIDFGAAYGTPIRAADGGSVIQAGWQGGYGKVVIINHGFQSGRNLTTLYGHMSGTAVYIGQQISKGQVIGYTGSTGFSTGPHLHFEVRDNGRPINPLAFLR